MKKPLRILPSQEPLSEPEPVFKDIFLKLVDIEKKTEAKKSKFNSGTPQKAFYNGQVALAIELQMYLRELRSESTGKKALYWLCKLFKAIKREGWEEGQTENEVKENIHDFLANRGLDSFIEEDQETIDQFISDTEEEFDNLF